MSRILFELPLVLYAGLPVAAAVLGVQVRGQLRRGEDRRRVLATAALRGAALLAVLFLAARPVWTNERRPRDDPARRKSVVVLVDRSASMSLEDGGSTRAALVNSFARERLLPALERSGLGLQALLFAEDAVRVAPDAMSGVRPDGKRTNLAGAIAAGLAASSRPPLAVIALTDGAANDHRDNGRALTALAEAGVPFVGIGFGSETRVRTLRLGQAVAPSTVPPKQQFQVSAELEMSSDREMLPFDLLLLSNGKVLQKKRVSAGKGQRVWLESFALRETTEGPRTYALQLDPPPVEGLRCTDRTATANVRISGEKRFRILFAEGALLWDYKFVRMALEGDPSLQLTGLIRTASQSFLHQDVSAESELSGGFPTAVKELAPFRVVILSGFRAGDLSAEQQAALKQFCGEYGGGVLLLGGPETFDPGWQQSTLEPLLPVVLGAGSQTPASAMPFRMRPTEDALQSPAFDLTGRGDRRAWDRLPTFTRCAPVDSAKPGALVLATPAQESGSDSHPRVLMAEQRYGAGLSAAICVGDLWRWRLARESSPDEFDRFWRQFLRHLGEQGGERVLIRLPDQNLGPHMDIRVVVEASRDPRSPRGRQSYEVCVDSAAGERVKSQRIELAPGQSVSATFRPTAPGVHTVSVRDARGVVLASRPVVIRESSIEFLNAARNMDALGQWAGLSGGLAAKAEECKDPGEILRKLRAGPVGAPRPRPRRLPVGMTAWVLALVLGCLSTEWILRKRWGMP